MQSRLKRLATTGYTRFNLERGKRRGLNVHRFLETKLGKTPKDLISASDAYARDVLGWSGYAPWLYVYSAIAGEFKEGWIPSNYFAHVVNARTKGTHGKLSRYKTISNRIFESDYFPDLAFRINGKYFSRDLTPISEADLEAILFASGEKAIFKSDDSNKGLGIFVITPQSLSQVLGYRDDGVFQRWVLNDPRAAAFAPGSVPTLRLTTVTEPDGKPGLRASYFRVGRAADKFLKASSLLRIPLDLATGEFGERAYFPDWSSTAQHPDSGLKFLGNRVPEYDACVQAALELHTRVPQVGCIGWDIAIDDAQKPVCMEWNGEVNDVKFTEALSGPSFLGLGWENLWKD